MSKISRKPITEQLTGEQVFNEHIIDYFAEHVVALCLEVQDLDGEGSSIGRLRFGCFSAFITELIPGEWQLATAGHCLRRLNDAVTGGKLKVERAWLMDFSHSKAKYRDPIPFEWDTPEQIYKEDDDAGLDFGFIRIPGIQKDNLQKNGIRPFSKKEISVENLQLEADYYLLGFPEELCGNDNAGNPTLSLQLLRVMKLPDDLTGRFLAKIANKGNLKSVEGMSGGVIIGFRWGEKEKAYKYWAVAIQSAWDKDEEVVKGSYIHRIHEQ